VIDFNNAAFVKLGAWNPDSAATELAPVLIPEERILAAFKGMRDSITFTSKRIIALNVQGMTGKKKDFSSLPYSHVQAWSVETAGVLDRDSELEMWFSGLGKVKLEFASGVDIKQLGALIAGFVLD
jgi:hypothetical protein